MKTLFLRIIAFIKALSYQELSLLDLAVLHGSEKARAGYIQYYKKLLPDSPDKLMEIGSSHGESLYMWKAWFKNTVIHTIDAFEEEGGGKEEIEKIGVIAHKGEQGVSSFLYTIKDQFEVIIDNGTHDSDDQQNSFKHLFVNNVKPGGIYVIEHLECCKIPLYWSKDITNFGDTMLSALLQYKHTGELSNNFFNTTENNYIKKLIADVKIFDDKIAFITRQ